MESEIVPGIYDAQVADVDLRVSTEDAYAMTRRLAADEGLLVGISSGANLVGALELAKSKRRESTLSPVFVIIFPDGGERYLSESFWSDTGEAEIWP